MRMLRIRRVVGPNENHLILIYRYIVSLVVEEGFRLAFGGESFNCCLLLSFNLLFCRPFLLLCRRTNGLGDIREFVLDDSVRWWVEAEFTRGSCHSRRERIIILDLWGIEYNKLLLRVFSCIILFTFFAKAWKFTLIECLIGAWDFLLRSRRPWIVKNAIL